MRIVIDTNVFVSAALKTGSLPYDVVQWIVTHGDLLKSADTEEELWLVMGRPRLAAAIVPSFFQLLRALLTIAESVEINERITACRDPKDNKFLELAVDGHAEVIVSGDADLLALHPFRSVPIETPAEFLRRIGS